MHDGESPLQRRIGELPLQQLHVTRRKVQRRADLVSDVGHRLAHGREFLCSRRSFAQLQHALVGANQLCVPLAQFLRFAGDTFGQRSMQILQLGKHRVETVG